MITQSDQKSSREELHRLENRVFDVIIVGAGVAGASAAVLAARRGMSVLLVESQTFPRDKVCGGCLNQRAQEFLNGLGLLAPICAAGAVRIDRFHVQIQERVSEWRVPMMLSVRRSTLDQMLADQAVHDGGTFVDQTRAMIQPIDRYVETKHRTVVLRRTSNRDETVSVSSKIVVVATGLSRASLPASEEWPASVMQGSRVGVQTLVQRDCVPKELRIWETGVNQLHMFVGSTGYIGICETDGKQVDLAAAIDPYSIRDANGVTQVIQQLLEECRIDASFLEGADWQSTPHLTRQSKRLAGRNIFLLGDATGYVEPFTGEGMSWAFQGSEALVPLLYQAILVSDTTNAEKEWTKWITKHHNQRLRLCRWIARKSRNTESAKWVLRMCDWFPPIRRQLLRSIMT